MDSKHADLIQRARAIAARQVYIDEVTAVVVELCNALSGSAEDVPEITQGSQARQAANSKRWPMTKPKPGIAARSARSAPQSGS